VDACEHGLWGRLARCRVETRRGGEGWRRREGTARARGLGWDAAARSEDSDPVRARGDSDACASDLRARDVILAMKETFGLGSCANKPYDSIRSVDFAS
jgi:hypothetical protein